MISKLHLRRSGRVVLLAIALVAPVGRKLPRKRCRLQADQSTRN